MKGWQAFRKVNNMTYHIPDYAKNNVPKDILNLNIGKVEIDHELAIKEALVSALKDKEVVGALKLLSKV